MIEIYLDERIEEDLTNVRILICSFAMRSVDLAALRQAFLSTIQVRKNRRLERIHDFIKKHNGRTVLTYADLSHALAQASEIDSTSDIPRMTRRDNIWATSILFNLADMCGILCREGAPMPQVRIFYDPKTLPILLEKAFREFIQIRIPRIAKEIIEKSSLDLPSHVEFQEVRQISKRKIVRDATQQQIGISVSHHLLTFAKELIQQPNITRIIISDRTHDLIEAIKPFTVTNQAHAMDAQKAAHG